MFGVGTTSASPALPKLEAGILGAATDYQQSKSFGGNGTPCSDGNGFLDRSVAGCFSVVVLDCGKLECGLIPFYMSW